MFYYSIFYFELHVVLYNLHLQSHEMCSAIALALSLFIIKSKALTFMSFVFLEHKFFEIRHYNSQYTYLN